MSAIPWTTVRDALQSWIALGSGLAGDHVVWSGQRDSNGDPMQRPTGQYISLRLTVIAQRGQDWRDYVLVGSQFTEKLRGPRYATLTAQCFQGSPVGGNEVDATSAMAVLHDALSAHRRDDINVALVAAGVGVTGFDPIQTTDAIIQSAKSEARALATVRLALASEISYDYPVNTGWIQFVNADGGSDLSSVHVHVST